MKCIQCAKCFKNKPLSNMLVPTDNKSKAMHVMLVHDDQKSPETFDKKGIVVFIFTVLELYM